MLFGFLQNTKVVLLEELACQFGLRTQDAIDRLQSLQDMERITGNIIFSIFCLNTCIRNESLLSKKVHVLVEFEEVTKFPVERKYSRTKVT